VIFDDRAALERQNTLREVAHVLQLVNTGGLTGEYEWTVLETEAVPASR
jgi:hypothetical protein